MEWIKLYTEARQDAKLRSLDDARFRVWFNLLCLAAEQPTRGTIAPMKAKILALEVSGGDVALLDATVAELVELEILRADGDGLTFLSFAKRQDRKPSDSAEETARRQREKRARDKSESEDMSRPCHAPVTPLSQPCHTTKSKNRERDQDPETEPMGSPLHTAGVCTPSAGEPEPIEVPFSEPLEGPTPDEEPELTLGDKPDRDPVNPGAAGAGAQDLPPGAPPVGKPKPKRHAYTEAFEAFWKAYPGTGVKSAAFSEWKSAGLERDDEARDRVYHALADQIEDQRRCHAAGQFWPQWKDAERWIKGACWEAKPRFVPQGPGAVTMAPPRASPARPMSNQERTMAILRSEAAKLSPEETP